MNPLEPLVERVCRTEHGFKDIVAAADELFAEQSAEQCFQISVTLIRHEKRQPRCLAAFLLGRLAATSPMSLDILRTRVSKDADWRVQEILAKAFDRYCADVGYENALPVIDDWLSDPSPKVRRAVTEGLRIWTGRAYFKAHPLVAIRMLSQHKGDDSEYLRKSVGNALHDIGKAHPDLVRAELKSWQTTDPKIAYTYKIAKRSL
jgi:3-methyladenine DNA glycosylase AlkD